MQTDKRIHKIVKSLSLTYETSDPFIIAKALGIQIRHKALGNLKGFYTVQHNIPYIVINRDLDYATARIICAHELGHDRLHRKLARSHILNEFEMYLVNTKSELEANTFAAHLLITDGAGAWMRKYNYDLLTAASILCTTPELLRIKVADELRLTDPYIFDVSHAVPNE